MRIKKFFAPTLSLALLLTLCSLLVYLCVSAKRKTDDLYKTLPANAYFVDSTSQKTVDKLIADISEIEGVQQVKFISKRDAAIRFYQKTDVDVNKMFKKNPLPQSLEIYFRPKANVQKIEEFVAAKQSVDQVDTPIKALKAIEQQATQISYYAGGFLTLFLLTVLYVIYTTARLDVAASASFVDTAKRQHLSPRQIRGPFMARALNNAVIAGVMASAFTFIATDGIATFFPLSMLTLEIELLAAIFASAILLSVILNTLFTYCAVNNQIYSSNK